MADKDKKVVNTEEQNRAVNPGDKSYEENTTPEENPVSIDNENEDAGEMEKPDAGTELQRPHRIEGDDVSGIERPVPDL